MLTRSSVVARLETDDKAYDVHVYRLQQVCHAATIGTVITVTVVRDAPTERHFDVYMYLFETDAKVC